MSLSRTSKLLQYINFSKTPLFVLELCCPPTPATGRLIIIIMPIPLCRDASDPGRWQANSGAVSKPPLHPSRWAAAFVGAC